MTLTIHVGAHKTASTHLQQTLRALIPDMLGAGIHYSDVAHWRGPGPRLTAALAAGARPRKGGARLRSLFDGIHATWPEVMLSEENILGSLRRDGIKDAARIYPDAEQRVARLARIMRHRPAVLCLAVREPLGFLGSAFAMQMQGGQELRFADYLDGFDPAALSWSGLARRLLSVRGVAGLIAWRYEDYPAVRGPLLRALLPERIAAAAPAPPPALVGLSQAAHDEIVARMEADPGADQVAVAREAKSHHPRGRDDGPPQLVPPQVAAQTAEAYAADIDRLAAMPRVRLLRP